MPRSGATPRASPCSTSAPPTARPSTAPRSGSAAWPTATSCGSARRRSASRPLEGDDATVPEGILTILKFCFLGLLYLFMARVVRAVYRELSPDRPGDAGANGRGRSGRARGGKGDLPARPYKLKMIDPA